jgi:hypothetical protein
MAKLFLAIRKQPSLYGFATGSSRPEVFMVVQPRSAAPVPDNLARVFSKTVFTILAVLQLMLASMAFVAQVAVMTNVFHLVKVPITYKFVNIVFMAFGSD